MKPPLSSGPPPRGCPPPWALVASAGLFAACTPSLSVRDAGAATDATLGADLGTAVGTDGALDTPAAPSDAQDVPGLADQLAAPDAACPVATPLACGGACVDPMTDRLNCGACGHACAATCSGGTCALVLQVGAGAVHTCARLSDETVWCWGANSVMVPMVSAIGMLGDGSTTNRPTPGRVPGLTSVGGMAVGVTHTCAKLDSGTVSCWGGNASGQLGDGTLTDRMSPTPVGGLTGVVSVAAGYQHTCALTTGGTAMCWGLNSEGELGDGTTVNRMAPVAVLDGTGAPLANIQELALGFEHTCARMTDNTVMCWGANYDAQLGAGPADSGSGSAHPVPVAAAVSNVHQLAANAGVTCALQGGGVVTCWGDNGFGQIGVVTDAGNDSEPPTAIAGLTSPTSVRVGGAHVCVVEGSGAVACWGADDLTASPEITFPDAYGQLGDGTRVSRTSPAPVTGLSNAVAVTLSIADTCALLMDGTVHCWGWGTYGQLGNGASLSSTVPVSVAW